MLSFHRFGEDQVLWPELWALQGRPREGGSFWGNEMGSCCGSGIRKNISVFIYDIISQGLSLHL